MFSGGVLGGPKVLMLKFFVCFFCALIMQVRSFIGNLMKYVRSDRGDRVADRELPALKEEWNLDDSSISKAKELLKLDKVRLPKGNLTERAKMRLFLYAKGIRGASWMAFRVTNRDKMFNPECVEMSKKMFLCLKQFVINEEDSSDVDQDNNTFTRFMAKCPEWGEATSYVCFRDDPKLQPSGLVERVQPSGLCYMHAPIVLQSYLVARTQRSNEAEVHNMICSLRELRPVYGLNNT